jgi:hypothetical protein
MQGYNSRQGRADRYGSICVLTANIMSLCHVRTFEDFMIFVYVRERKRVVCPKKREKEGRNSIATIDK